MEFNNIPMWRLVKELQETGTMTRSRNLHYEKDLRPALYRLIEYVFTCDLASQVNFDDFTLEEVDQLFEAIEGYYSCEELYDLDDEESGYQANWNNPIYEYLHVNDTVYNIIFHKNKMPVQADIDFI
jgi:hypothetical protein